MKNLNNKTIKTIFASLIAVLMVIIAKPTQSNNVQAASKGENVAVNYVPGYGIAVWNGYIEGSLTGQYLSHGTTWRVTNTATDTSGNLWYDLGVNQWIDSRYTQNAVAVSQAAEQTSNQGTFKLSFYDPKVLGSNMGYSGVAANLSVFPKGTKLKITLSDGTVWYRTVNDTGGFAYSNPRQLDVAMPNYAIPSAGILYANVQVIY
ncbi:hypothetical protein [Holzapfeliella sp. JNUCC 72]